MPDWSETAYQLVRGLGLGAALAIGLALEFWRPHERMKPALRTNLGLWGIDALIMAVVCGACGWTVAQWGAGRGLGLFPSLGAGSWTASLLGILALDAVSYAWHRANHQLPFLWRFHQVHHGDAAFHVTTALRFHPGELLMALPVRLAAVLLLGVPPEGVLLFELIFGVANLLEHGNFDLPEPVEPFVQRVLITPALHRTHHSADWQELNTNFGTVLSIWDRLARTLRSSSAARRIATGLPDRVASQPPSVSESLLLPFSHATPQRR